MLGHLCGTFAGPIFAGTVLVLELFFFFLRKIKQDLDSYRVLSESLLREKAAL